MTTTTLPADVTVHHAVGGSADVVLAENKIEHRLQPLLRFAEPDGREHVVELSTKDVVSIMRSLVVMFSAQQPQISTWWKTLTGE